MWGPMGAPWPVGAQPPTFSLVGFPLLVPPKQIFFSARVAACSWVLGVRTKLFGLPLERCFVSPEEGLSCFLVPRWLPDGRRNAGFNVQRLKAGKADVSAR